MFSYFLFAHASKTYCIVSIFAVECTELCFVILSVGHRRRRVQVHAHHHLPHDLHDSHHSAHRQDLHSRRRPSRNGWYVHRIAHQTLSLSLSLSLARSLFCFTSFSPLYLSQRVRCACILLSAHMCACVHVVCVCNTSGDRSVYCVFNI